MTREEIIDIIQSFGMYAVYHNDYSLLAAEIHQQQEEEAKQFLIDFADWWNKKNIPYIFVGNIYEFLKEKEVEP